MRHIKKLGILILIFVIVIAVVALSVVRYVEKRNFFKRAPKNYFELINKKDNTIELPYIELGESIPKIFHRTHEIKESIDLFSDVEEKIKKLHPDYEIINYTSEDRENFIKKHFSERIFKAYKSINPIYGVVKADFFRYCVVYIKGGIYLDIKSLTIKNIDNILKKARQKMIVTKDFNYINYGMAYILFPYGEQSQWIVTAPKGHKVLKEIILHSVINIESDYGKSDEEVGFKGGKSCINICGPIVYSLITTKKENRDSILYLSKLYDDHILKFESNFYGPNGKQEVSSLMAKTKPYSALNERIVKEYNF